MRPRTVLHRTLAAFLCCQPVLWMSDVAYAQSVLDAAPGRGRDTGTSPPRAPAGEDLGDGPLVPPGSSPFRTDAPDPGALAGMGARPPPVDAPLDPDAYVCGPGDELEVNLWGLQTIRLRLVADLEGRVFVPKVGQFVVRGKTLTAVRRELAEAARRVYPRLQFDLALAQPRTFVVQVADAVARPGAHAARATDRVSTLLDRAGGLLPTASRRRIELRRRDGTVVRADLLRYGRTGDTSENPYLLDGDVVRVPFEELLVGVAGAVNRPGRYELVATRDLAELLELAGGLAPTATRSLPVTVVRPQPDGRELLDLVAFGPDGALPSRELRPGETVRFPFHAEVQRVVTVSGALAGVPGPEDPSANRRVPFVEGDTVRTLLDRLGGVGPHADLSGAYVVRKDERLPVDLHALLALRRLEADRPLALDDTLVVPFARRSVRVGGAVHAPGLYPHDPSFGVDEYVALAGGPNKFAQSVTKSRVVSPDGERFEYDPRLRIAPGSSVVVPERSFSRSEVVQLVISATSVIISGVAVFLAARQ
jgi:protein involved in polysaccharide export with SLBB domain